MSNRSVEEITRIFESAKLSIDDLLPLSQEIYFDAQLSGSDLRLLELEKEVGDCIRVGDRLVIRGEPDDTAVLCTNDSSFELKRVETSNSLLIFNQLSFPEDVDKLDNVLPLIGPEEMVIEDNSLPHITNGARNQFIGKRSILHVAHSYHELTKIKPILSRIGRILEPSSYCGPTETEDLGTNASEFITFEKLLDQVPGSESEIRDFISRNLRTFEMDGNIRLVGDDYLFRTLSQVLDCVESYSWKVTSIDKDVVIRELNGLHSDFLLEKVFEWFFSPQVTRMESDALVEEPEGLILYEMNEFEISRLLGMMILKAGGKFTLTDFLSAWSESVPSGLKVNLKQLEGLAVTDELPGHPPVIWYFPESNLPETIPERFQALFTAKAKWKQDDILPYLENVSVSPQAASLLMTKHSRVYNVGGTKYCCSKHGK